MASNKQIDVESQKPAASSSPAATVPPASVHSVEPPAVPVSVGITNGHDVPQETEPLLLSLGDGDGDGGAAADADDDAKRLERAITRAFRSTAELAKHLPTGAVLVFEVLSPVFTNGGQCRDVNRVMTAWLVGLCAAACCFLCFTDSFHDRGGTVRYVVATRSGLWVIDGTAPPPPDLAATYRLRFIDYFHAVLSLVVFMSVAMFDHNVGACFYPVMSYDTRQVLTAVPLAGGLVGTMLFATFPSTRHGIGFPVHVA
ncbi:protein DMP4-like [Oryza brachyantha]|uniref:protein DMP4-like n=1 Tax=Oryza brachyantha TaxID=4533 RepID=UPI001AD9DC87|nr:protein DMP4-like [Oryza brachyantha]